MARRVIYKHQLGLIGGPQVVEVMGPGAQVLDFQVQDGALTIWTLEDLDAHRTEERFQIIGTGDRVPDGWTHIGTVQRGAFVWHLFRAVR